MRGMTSCGFFKSNECLVNIVGMGGCIDVPSFIPLTIHTSSRQRQALWIQLTAAGGSVLALLSRCICVLRVSVIQGKSGGSHAKLKEAARIPAQSEGSEAAVRSGLADNQGHYPIFNFYQYS